jgi:hypothetical protein
MQRGGRMFKLIACTIEPLLGLTGQELGHANTAG